MALGPQTRVVDGQRFSGPTATDYAPVGFGQLVQPQPISNVNFPPMVTGSPSGSSAMTESVGGYGTAGQNVIATAQAAAHPFGLRESPLWWAIIGLIVSIVGLSVVHWRKTTLAGGRENLHVGSASEEGGAEV